MTDRLEISSRILAGLVANPAIIAVNGMSGWKLVNCTESDLAAYADHIASYLIDLELKAASIKG